MTESYSPASGDGILRALHAQGRRAERQHILDTLEAAELSASRQARETRSRMPSITAPGRRAAGMRTAYELLTSGQNSEFATNAGVFDSQVSSDCDTIELWHFDPDDGPDLEEFPVRVVVADGAESTTSSAYLRLDEAAEHARAVLALVDRLTAARANRQDARKVVRTIGYGYDNSIVTVEPAVVTSRCGPGTVCAEFHRSGSAHTEVCCDIAEDPRAT